MPPTNFESTLPLFQFLHGIIIVLPTAVKATLFVTFHRLLSLPALFFPIFPVSMQPVNQRLGLSRKYREIGKAGGAVSKIYDEAEQNNQV